MRVIASGGLADVALKKRQVYTPHMKVIAIGGLEDVRLKKDRFIPHK